MGTSVRPELSRKNPYWLERHRFYELKHFCLQYPIWRQARDALDGLSRRPADLAAISRKGEIPDPTAKCAEARAFYTRRMEMVERAAKETDEVLGGYILAAVTEGLSYNTLAARSNIPCCKDVYYHLYRRFFWILNRIRE